MGPLLDLSLHGYTSSTAMDADFNTKGRRRRDGSLFMRSSRHAYTGGLLQLHFLQSRFDLGLRAKAAVLSLLLPLRVTIVE